MDTIRQTAIYTPRSWTEHLPIDELFPARNPIEVDVGCGKGKFLAARAKAAPGANFLGIDRRLKYLRRADRKVIHGGLANVTLLRVEASYAVSRMLPPECATAFYIFFPDPWPKKRHHKRRMFVPAFVDSLHAVLVRGGRIHVATDQSDYFEIIRGLLVGDARFREIEPFVTSEAERSSFELIFLAQLAWIGRCSFEKIR